MSNVQFYLTIGIPTLAVLIGILMNVVQSTRSMLASAAWIHDSAHWTAVSNLEARFEPFNSIDARFNNLEVKFDTLIGKVVELDNRVTRIEAKLDIR